VLLALLTLVNAAHHAQHFRGLAVVARKPAALILQPQAGAAAAASGAEAIFDFKANARAAIRRAAAHHRVVAAGQVVGVEKGGELAPGGHRLRVAAQHLCRPGRPADHVLCHVPVIGRQPRICRRAVRQPG